MKNETETNINIINGVYINTSSLSRYVWRSAFSRHDLSDANAKHGLYNLLSHQFNREHHRQRELNQFKCDFWDLLLQCDATNRGLRGGSMRQHNERVYGESVLSGEE